MHRRVRVLALPAVALVLGMCLIGLGVYMAIQPMLTPIPEIPASGQPRVASIDLPTATPYPTVTASPIQPEIQIPTPTATWTTAQALAAADIPVRDLPALAVRLKHVPDVAPRAVDPSSPHYELGQQEVFWVVDSLQMANKPVTATLRYASSFLYMWVEDGYDMNMDDLQRSAERFEQITYPTNRDYFGSEWSPGIDNDPRISIFNGRLAGAAGYFYSPNQYSRQVHPFSNEKEMFFINLDVRQPGTDAYDSTLAHEFQHMIHWHNDRNEDTWVNEGLSMLAEQVNGFSVMDYAREYLLWPDTQLTSWATDGHSTIPHYGASYLFMAYFLEQNGQEAVRMLVRSRLNGAAGFNQVLRELEDDRDFDALFSDWVIANYLDDPSLAGGQYGYRDLDLPRPALIREHNQYPISVQGTVSQYGVNYIRLGGNPGENLLIQFTGNAETQLTDFTPPSGRWSWWSNRGDYSNMTLTRAFDLTGVDSATLSIWMWYDIEKDWDYAYITASGDGGRTWQVLAGEQTVDTNPHGNSYGPAYTGVSGGGSRPEWIRERIDLSRFAGGPLLLRFKLVTDDGVNHTGLFIDDLSIPEIGFFDDMETDDGKWEAAGFIRCDNVLPQGYIVQLIEFFPDAIRLSRMELDSSNSGTMRLSGLGVDMEEAILAISATAPATTMPATISYEIRSDD